MRTTLIWMILIFSLLASPAAAPEGRRLIAHRGSSAYAPEHTLEAYQLAIEQGADYIEQDLQISRDGILVCMHDPTLERTTNVEDLFPDRYRLVSDGESRRRHWFVEDFSLEELKRLDAGSWYHSSFAGARIPTFREAIEAIKGKAGLYPETKNPQDYYKQGRSMERILVSDLLDAGLDPFSPDTPVIVQSFSPDSLRRLRSQIGIRLTQVLLIGESKLANWLSDSGLEEAKSFANGIGPHKQILIDDPTLVERAHRLGLTVTPYTFRDSGVLSPFQNVSEEMSFFLYKLKVDALFTDNPDRFPRDYND